MKKIIIILFLVIPIEVFCQKQSISTKDSLKAYTNKLIGKALKKRNFKVIAIWDFTDPQKELSNQGSYISDQVSIYATDIDSIIVVDRQNLNSIIREHSLKDKDFLIDQEALLHLGKFSGAEVLMVGKVSIFETECAIQLYLKIVDANTAQTLAAAEEYIPIDRKFADVSGLALNCLGINATGRPGRDFNASTSSNEQYNNNQKLLLEQKCEHTNIGICCFFNNSNENIKVEFYKKNDLENVGDIQLKPAESKCFYYLPAGQSYKFIARIISDNVFTRTSANYDEGDILIEKCKSKTYTIKKMVVTETKKAVNEEVHENAKNIFQKIIQAVKDKTNF